MPTFAEGDLTPGTLYYMRHWSVEGRKLQIASFKSADGQLWWVPDASLAKGIAPRSFCLMLNNRPVAVKGTPEYRLAERPSRLVVELASDVATSSATLDPGPMSTRAARRVSVTFTDLIKSLADGWEMVDATLESS